MSIVVLGAGGYTGSHIVNELCEREIEVIAVDNLSTGFKEACHRSARFYQGDIRDINFLKIVFRKERPDVIIHTALYSGIFESFKNPLKYYNNNLYGTMVLLEAIKESEVNKLVFTSSAAVYGKSEKAAVKEDDITEPISPFGETVLAAEKMIKWFSQENKITYALLRCFNQAGAHENGCIGSAHSPETHLVPNVMKTAAAQIPLLNIYGNDYETKDGTCIRDYVHVVDVAKAHVKAANYLIKSGESDVFNIGTGTGTSVAQICRAATKLTEMTIKSGTLGRRTGDAAHIIADTKKTEEVLMWRARRGVEEIIESAWKWHSTHPFGYKT